MKQFSPLADAVIVVHLKADGKLWYLLPLLRVDFDYGKCGEVGRSLTAAGKALEQGTGLNLNQFL